MEKLILYKQRWFILVVVCLINFSNNMAWISFAPISSYTVDYYANENAPMLFNVIYMACAPMGFVSMWVTGKHGLRVGCFIGAWLNLIGTLLRLYAASTIFFAEEWRFIVTFIGQTFAACAQPFVMYLPAKLAAVWFPDSQRVLANTLASLSNPLGAATMFALSPQIVNGATPKAFFMLNGIVTFLAGLSTLLSLGVTRSHPPTPPSASAAAGNNALNQINIQTPNSVQDIWRGICQAFRSKSFIVLMFGLGSGFGLFNSLYNNLQPALCSKGYSNSFSGAIGAGMIFAGLFFSSIFGIIVDKTRLFEETMKVCMCACALCACAIMVLLRFTDKEVLVAIAVLAFGSFSLAIYPIGLELGVETTFPVSETSSTGLLILAGQIFGVFFVFLTSFLKRPATAHELIVQTCTLKEVPIGVYDWKYSFMVWNGCLVVTCVLFTFSFWPKYRRMDYEMNEIRARQSRQENETE